LKNEIISEFKSIISSWRDRDIYAISFYVNNFCDNPCEPTVTLGYNTERQYEKSKERTNNEQEARWNYAFWLQNKEFIFGKDETKEIVKNWIIHSGLPYFPCVDYDFDIPDSVDNEVLRKITKGFVDILVDIVKELHSSGFIQNKFGRTIPVIIHELEYYNEIAQQNERANSFHAASEFAAWIYGDRYERV